MGIQVSAMFICILVFTVNRMLVGAKSVPSENVTSFNRHSFPKGFVFGTGSASYQYEGGANEGGKGPSIWDTFTHQHPEKIKDRSNGDIALDSYHLYKEDVKTMTNMNVDAYRFSISWSRIIPTGRIKDGVNKVGIQYYNNLINLLLSKGVQPYGTIFHWDVPQGLEDEYLGFLSPRIVKDFEDFADLCFKEFGDRIKHWITLNEPITFSRDGYSTGVLAPGRCSSFLGNCTRGDSSTEPYGVAHNLLLSHAAAVKLYKKTYQVSQKGQIGITNFCSWLIPLTKSQADKDAAQRALDFLYGWFMHPIVYGEYPMSMQMLVGNRQPKFTKEQSKMLKGSYDFIGVNYYTSYYVSHAPPNGAPPSYGTDSQTTLTAKKNGILIGAQSASSWIYVYPRGIKDLLVYTKELYKNPTLYITENGVNDINNSSLSLKESLQDHKRINYHSRHLQFLLDAIKEGVNVKGYFGWSLLDNFEWGDGYTIRFGINYVDYKNGLKRYPKSSALWFRKFLKR